MASIDKIVEKNRRDREKLLEKRLQEKMKREATNGYTQDESDDCVGNNWTNVSSGKYSFEYNKQRRIWRNLKIANYERMSIVDLSKLLIPKTTKKSLFAAFATINVKVNKSTSKDDLIEKFTQEISSDLISDDIRMVL